MKINFLIKIFQNLFKSDFNKTPNFKNWWTNKHKNSIEIGCIPSGLFSKFLGKLQNKLLWKFFVKRKKLRLKLIAYFIASVVRFVLKVRRGTKIRLSLTVFRISAPSKIASRNSPRELIQFSFITLFTFFDLCKRVVIAFWLWLKTCMEINRWMYRHFA